MNFGEALEALKEGKSITREVWKGRWFLSRNPSMEDKLDNGYTRSYGFINGLIVAELGEYKGCAPAQPYQSDLLAEDWKILN